MADTAQPQAPGNGNDEPLPEILTSTRDAVFAAERLVLPESLQHINVSSIPLYTEVPHWARAMGCQQFGVPFQSNANGAVYTVRIMGLLVCPMHYSNPAVRSEALQLHLNDRRVLRIRTRVYNAATRTHHLLNSKFVTANGNMRVPSHALWMRIYSNWHVRVHELRRGQSQPAPPGCSWPPLHFDHAAMNQMLASTHAAPAPAAAPPAAAPPAPAPVPPAPVVFDVDDGAQPAGAGHDTTLANRIRRVVGPLLNQAFESGAQEALLYGPQALPWRSSSSRMLARTAARMWARRSAESRQNHGHWHPVLLGALGFLLGARLQDIWNPGESFENHPSGGEEHAEGVLMYLGTQVASAVFEHWRQDPELDVVQIAAEFDAVLSLPPPGPGQNDQLPVKVIRIRWMVWQALSAVPVPPPPPRPPPTPEAVQARFQNFADSWAVGLQRVLGMVARRHEADAEGFQVYHIDENGEPQFGRAPDVAPDATLDKPTEAELAALQDEAEDDKKNASGSAAKVCVICMDNPVRVVFTGCGHATCCAVCVNKLERKCPTCRKVSKPIRMYT